MNKEEKLTYFQRVDRWEKECFPQLMASCRAWCDVPVKDFDEGLILVSAIKRARPFIRASEHYMSAEKVILRMHTMLEQVRQESGLAKLPFRYAADPRKWVAAPPVQSVPDENGETTTTTYQEPEVDGRRPQHVDQYIHLLPKHLQDEASGLQQMHMLLAMYRGQLEHLSADRDADKQQIAELAEKTVKQEQAIRLLYQKLDAAYKQAKGEELTEQELLLTMPAQPQALLRRPGEYTKQEIDLMPLGPTRSECEEARIEANKKYIRRAAPKTITDDYRQQLALRIKELQEWDAVMPSKTEERCKAAGVEF